MHDDDVPTVYSLTKACQKFFAGTRINERVLRKEAKAGRLKIKLIGGKEYVTAQAIKEMLELCPENKSQQDFAGSGEAAAAQSGSSEMAAKESALEYLKTSLLLPTERSRTTTSQKRRKHLSKTKAKVIPFQSSSSKP